jgi:transketolase
MMRAMVAHNGPVYIRVNRNDLPVYTSESGDFQIGKIYPIVEGSDVVIFATGAMVYNSVLAAEKLKAENISVQVVNVSTLKPLLKDEVLRYAKGKKGIVTAEEAVKIGGLGNEIAGMLFGTLNVPLVQVGVDDEFGTSAHNYEELLVKYHLSSDDIYKAVKKSLGKHI